MSRRILTKNLAFIVFFTLFLSGVFVFFTKSVFASSTDGTIDLTYKYAWSENIGWVNFSCDNCNVHITDSGFTGSALGENIGWIDLGNVVNDGEGNLSGYGWAENSGWIKFNPTNGGVVINSSGEFTGSALSENIGWIIFDCSTSACVKTDWRPQSARVCVSWTYSDWSSCSNSQQTRTIISSSPSGCGGGSPVLTQSCSSGGGGMPVQWSNLPAVPVGGFGVSINNGAKSTVIPNIILNLKGGSDTAKMAISNSLDFKDASQENYASTKEWNLCQNNNNCDEGEYVIYVKFYTSWGQSSEVVSDTIVYQKAKSIIEKIEEIPKKIIEEVKKAPEILKPLVPEFLKPKAPEIKLPEVSIEELMPKEAPLAFQGRWQLLSRESINEFVLAPLPKAIRNLAQKFPTLEKTFKETGIVKITDVAKLKMVKLSLPGLTERVGLPQVVPVAKLSPSMKQQMPAEIVFAKTGGGLIDFNLALSVTEDGEPQEKISTISGKSLQLAVKPDKPVKSVKGYVVFKSKGSSPTSLELPFNSLLASMIFSNPVFAKTQDQPVRVEEKLVLLEFEYTDSDGDGIYTAEIQAPVIEGEYEIITVMDFEDPDLGKKEIRLITVVDPEGYVYEKAGDKETRVPGAIISLFWLNSETKQYELWPAKKYQQENPQTTDVRGTYSFLVPEGYYYLKAEAPGYLVYDGKSFQVKEGSGIHINIELKTKYWWLKVIDWKVILLVIVMILLLYNFYRDKIRERLARSKNI